MNKNEALIIEIQQFPLINWIKYSFFKKHIILLTCEGYRRASFRNRYVVAGSNGVIKLSTPLINGRNQNVPFKEVRISYMEKWQLVHWRTITSCYNKSPWFDYYRDQVYDFFFDRWEFLFDWNLAILYWLKKVLKFPAEIILIDQYPDEVEDGRDKWLPKNFQDNDQFIRYPQVFEDRIGFQKNLSILDMLFNVGPHAANLLKSSS